MNSEEIRDQILALEAEIDAYEKRLKLPQPDVEDTINSEIELAARRSVVLRFERQLSDALAQEKTVQEKKVRAGLETELAGLELQFQELNGELNQEVRETANNLVSALSRCLAIRSRLGPIVKGHQDTYLKLHGKYPERSLGSFMYGMRVKADEQSIEADVADVALTILDHESFNGEFRLENWLSGVNQVVTAMRQFTNSYVPVQPEPNKANVDMNDPFFNEFQS
jgi:hypothetical protein